MVNTLKPQLLPWHSQYPLQIQEVPKSHNLPAEQEPKQDKEIKQNCKTVK